MFSQTIFSCDQQALFPKYIMLVFMIYSLPIDNFTNVPIYISRIQHTAVDEMTENNLSMEFRFALILMVSTVELCIV